MIDPLNKEQLALSLTLPDGAELENFVVGTNALAVNRVQSIARGLGDFLVFLWGPPEVGKTHLLQGACFEATSQGLSSIYLPLKNRSQYKPNYLEGLEQLDLICMDDIQSVQGDSIWEEHLFYLYNRLKAANKHLIISSDRAPAQIAVLPDLRTRLGWGEIYHLSPLSDDEKTKALQVRAQQRGLILSEEVGKFILNRVARSMGELYDILERLDKASLTYQRRLTLPFVKQVLGL